jgi:hypothetical protein
MALTGRFDAGLAITVEQMAIPVGVKTEAMAQ